MDVQITVASKTPGIAGKPTSKVTDTTGKTWLVFNDKFPQFQEGNSYLITKYKVNEFKGSTYYMVESFTPTGGAAANARAAPNGYTTTTAGTAARYPVDSSKTDNERRMDIFICGAFNNILSNPSVNPLELSLSDKATIVEELRTIWISSLGPNRPSSISTAPRRMETTNQTPASNPDMNDSIPF